MKTSLLVALYFILSLPFYNNLIAQDGQLDPTFGVGGIVTTSIGSGNDYGQSVAIQSDGKIVVAGSSGNGVRNDFAVLRYNIDGSLDGTFGIGGIVITQMGVPNLNCSGRSVVIQNDEKIIVAGNSHSENGFGVFALVRYHSNGMIDSSFNDSGKVMINFSYYSARINSLALQNDGKIIASGTHVSGYNHFVTARLNTDGSLDTSFGNDGVISTSVGADYSQGANSVAVQNDGKIVLSGSANGFITIIRYNTDGSLDPTFDGDGTVTSISGNAYSLKIQNDNKLLVGGGSLLGRFNTNGAPDNSFGINGFVTTSTPGGSVAINSLAIDNYWRIVAAGYLGNDFAIMRFTTNGTLDSAFGINGTMITSLSPGNDRGYSVAIQNNNNIVLAGITSNGTNVKIGLTRSTASQGSNYDLVAYYPFNGNANDESGNANHGIINGATLTNDRFENPNSAFYFDGIDDFIDCGIATNVNPNTQSFSISAWIAIEHKDNSPDNFHSILSKQDGINDYSGFGFSFNQLDNNLNFLINDEGDWTSQNSVIDSSSIDINNPIWHHVVAIADKESEKLKLYVDGTLVNEETITITGNIAATLGHLLLGNYFDNSISQNHFKGILDDIKIYHRSISDYEIQELYLEGGWVINDKLVAYYPFNENPFDESGCGNDGTVNGDLQWSGNRFGIPNKASSFDGVDDYINVGGSYTLKTNGDFSVAAWIKTNATKNQSVISKFYFFPSPPRLSGWSIKVENMTVIFEARDANNSNVSVVSQEPLDTNWHFVVAQKYGNQWKLFIDGVLINDTIRTIGSISNSSNMLIGKSAIFNDYFDGQIDDIRIYNYAIPEQEILNLYREGGWDIFEEVTSISLPGVSGSSVAWGDYDNDGDLDLLLSGSSGSGAITKIFRNNSDNTFTELTSFALTGEYFSSAIWGDYDNDGYLDILLAGSVTKIYRNNGDNTFIAQTSILLPGLSQGSAEWSDYDNDGYLDILLTGSIGGSNYVSKIYRNNQDNSFTEQTSISLIGVYDGSVAWGDYDNDGDLDILLSGGISPPCATNSNVSIVYKNNGDNTFTEQSSISLTGVLQSSVAWGDYDADGDLDILLTGYDYCLPGVQKSLIYRNNGDNTFTEQSSIVLTGVGGSEVAWGDYNNDGYLDFVLTGYGYSDSTIRVSKIYHINGDNTFTEQSSISLTAISDGAVAWGDFDNDGDLDLIIAGNSSTGRVTKIYKNNINKSNTPPSQPLNLTSSNNGNEITFSWDKSTDNETPQNGLTYNLVIGTSPSEVNTLSPMSDRTTGFRRVVSLGNTNHNNSWTIKGLLPRKYYWSVQAIDNNFSGSAFADVQEVTGSYKLNYSHSITISDANIIESSSVLYFGQDSTATDSIDTNLLEEILPPLPPPGVYDARFVLPSFNVESLRDFRNDTKKFVNWKLQFQGVAPFQFSWDSTALPPGNFFLRDDFGGILLNINMKEQSSYLLPQSLPLTQLLIEHSIFDCKSFSVNADWNMVSIPMVLEDSSKTTMFPTAITDAFWFNGSYQTQNNLVPRKGYWLKFDQSESFEHCGTTVDDTIHIKAGWNMIGSLDENIPKAQISTVPTGIITGNYWGYNSGYNIADTLKIGNGYWVLSSAAGILELNNVLRKKVEYVNPISSDWASIFISDAQSKKMELYLNEDEEITGFDLPPLPPAGAFDVRFSNSKMVESLSDGELQINISSANYPIRLKANGVDLLVTDAVNGQLLNTKVTNGSELLITDSRLDKIKISGKLSEGVPTVYSLEQNYPNPFNPSTTIKFSVPEEVMVNLSIFNILGERVTELKNEIMKPGFYSVDFNASSLASGVYLYRIQAGEFISTKKLMLLK